MNNKMYKNPTFRNFLILNQYKFIKVLLTCTNEMYNMCIESRVASFSRGCSTYPWWKTIIWRRSRRTQTRWRFLTFGRSIHFSFLWHCIFLNWTEARWSPWRKGVKQETVHRWRLRASSPWQHQQDMTYRVISQVPPSILQDYCLLKCR